MHFLELFFTSWVRSYSYKLKKSYSCCGELFGDEMLEVLNFPSVYLLNWKLSGVIKRDYFNQIEESFSKPLSYLTNSRLRHFLECLLNVNFL